MIRKIVRKDRLFWQLLQNSIFTKEKISFWRTQMSRISYVASMTALNLYSTCILFLSNPLPYDFLVATYASSVTYSPL